MVVFCLCPGFIIGFGRMVSLPGAYLTILEAKLTEFLNREGSQEFSIRLSGVRNWRLTPK